MRLAIRGAVLLVCLVTAAAALMGARPAGPTTIVCPARLLSKTMSPPATLASRIAWFSEPAPLALPPTARPSRFASPLAEPLPFASARPLP